MNIRPIKTTKDYKNALSEIEKLWDVKPNTSDGDRLDVLATLVEAWEDKYYPLEEADPIEAIKFHMEQNSLTRKDLEPIFGTRARVSEVLNRKRELTLNMIRNLNRQFKIPASVLIV